MLVVLVMVVVDAQGAVNTTPYAPPTLQSDLNQLYRPQPNKPTVVF